MVTYVALAADHLVAVELGGQGLERGLNQTTAETEDQVQGRLLLKQNRSANIPKLPIFCPRAFARYPNARLHSVL